MPLKIVWDRFETALIIEAYLMVERGEVSRKKAISTLSQTLRYRAIEKGLAIDEIYRNENGVAMQLGNIQRLMRRTPNCDKHNSKVFVEMVNISQTDTQLFNSILSDAKGGIPPLKTNQQLFVAWLSEHVSSKDIPEYLHAIAQIELFAQKKKIINGSLYDATSPIQSKEILSAIAADRFFRFLHKKQMHSIMRAIKSYHNYTKDLENKATQINAVINTHKVSKCMPSERKDTQIQAAVINTDVKEIGVSTESFQHKTEMSSESSTPVPSEEHSDLDTDIGDMLPQAQTVDFSSKADYSFTKPVSATYFGEAISTESWRKLYVQTCKFLYDDYPHVFERLRRDVALGNKHALIHDIETSKRLTAPEEIADGFYVETNRSASVLIHNLRTLLDACLVDYENLEIHYVRTAHNEDNAERSKRDVAEVDDPVIQFLNSRQLEYIDFRDRLGCLWIIGGHEIDETIQLLKDAGVTLTFKAGGGNATKGRTAWWTKDNTHSILLNQKHADTTSEDQSTPAFLSKSVSNTSQILVSDKPLNSNTSDSPKSLKQLRSSDSSRSCERQQPKQSTKAPQEEGASAGIGSTPQQKELSSPLENGQAAFSRWLKSRGFSDGPVRSCIWNLTMLSCYASDANIIASTIFDISNTAELDRIWNKLVLSPKFRALEKGNTAIAADFKKYLIFRIDQNGKGGQSIAVVKNNASSQPKATIKNTETSSMRQSFAKWMNTQGYSFSTCRGYASAITGIDEYVKRHNLSSKSLYLITSKDEFSDLWQSLMQSREFIAYNREQHNRFSAAAKKYTDFLAATSKDNVQEPVSTKLSIQTAYAPANHLSRLNIHPGRVEFEAWLKDSGTPSGSVKTYAECLEHISCFLLDRGLEDRQLYSIRGISRLERILAGLSNSAEFAQSVSGRPTSLELYALKKYINFRNGDSVTNVDPSVADCFSIILRDNFEDGYRIHSVIDRNRFKQFYADRFHSEPAQSDDEIVQIICRLGTEQDGRVFIHSGSNRSDLLDDILADVAHTFHAGATCIYYSELYGKYQEALAEQLQVYSQDTMKELLLSTAYGEFRSSRFYFYLSARHPDADIDISRVMRGSPVPLNYERIHTELWYIPLDTIKHCLVTTTAYVNVAQETYFYAQNLPISNEELCDITVLIHKQLAQKSFLTGSEVRGLIAQNYPSIAINTEGFTTWGLRNCLAVLLKDQFSFNGPIISELGQEVNMSRVFYEFCHEHDSMTMDDLNTFAKDVNNGIIYWDSVMEAMVRTSQNEFIRKDQIAFDVSATDALLDQLLDGEYMPIKEFQLFLHYPSICVKWNKFVLESYVAGYSSQFILLHASYTSTDCYGAIVRKESNIQNFPDLLLDVLTHDNSWKTKEDALSMLVAKGYLQRKRYTKIDTILPAAKLEREKQNNTPTR